VDRLRLKEKLIRQCLDAGVVFHFGRAKACKHSDEGSSLECLSGLNIAATVVVDATGHARKLTVMDGKHDPGYQAAYGIMAGAML
jgi:ribulose 1,5-bisphosphate synthetase/thiazole synthase